MYVRIQADSLIMISLFRFVWRYVRLSKSSTIEQVASSSNSFILFFNVILKSSSLSKRKKKYNIYAFKHNIAHWVTLTSRIIIDCYKIMWPLNRILCLKSIKKKCCSSNELFFPLKFKILLVKSTQSSHAYFFLLLYSYLYLFEGGKQYVIFVTFFKYLIEGTFMYIHTTA